MIVKSNLISIFPPKTSRSVVEGSNGINLESICTSWKTEEEGGATGNYVLDGTFIVDKEGLYKNIVEEAILKVRIEGRFEYFVINKPKINTRTVTITALHITIREQKQLWLNDVRPTNSNGLGTLQHLYSNATGTKEITLSSDIPVLATAYYQLMNMYKALYDCDQSFINRWGGETKRRGYNVTINQKRSSDSNLVIREGKNLTGFDVTTNTDTFCTRGLGKGFDGIKGDYVESPLINKYARVNTQVFEYNDVRLKNADKNEEEGYMYFDTLEEAKAELNRRVALEFSENHIDEIQATYDISFEQLADTEEYKNYAYLETAEVGDIVKVYVPSLDIEVSVRVTKKIYNGSTQRTDSMTLSNTTTSTTLSMATIIADLKAQYIKTGNDNMNEYLTSIINAGMQDSNVIVRKNEILIMDTADINTAKSVWRFNNGALTHTNNGYYANDWNIGLTKDGIINADMIRTGILTAITIKSVDGSFMMNLGQNGGCNFYTNNTIAMKISNSNIGFYNFLKENQLIGSVGCAAIIENGVYNPDKPYTNLWHEKESFLDIDYRFNDGNSYPYVRFDLHNIYDSHTSPVEFFQTIGLVENASLAFYKKGNRLDPIGFIGRFNNSDFCIANKEDNILRFCYSSDNFNTTTTMVEVSKDGFKAYGDKNCIQKCEYGDVKFSSVEDIGSYLTWREYGGKYSTVLDNNNEYSCTIEIPQIIKSTINTKIAYNIEVNAISSFANIAVFEMTETNFTIKSTEPCSFNFVLCGKRKGFEQRSLEEQILEGEQYMKEEQKIATIEYEEFGICIDD